MDFVYFNIARKLKEKGFREKCFAIYTPYGGILKFNEIDTDKISPCDLNIKDFGKCYNYYTYNNIDAPTIPQVLKWLRKEKKIYITVNVEREDWFEYKIVQLIKNTHYTSNRVYETYDDAMLAGIEDAIDNLI